MDAELIIKDLLNIDVYDVKISTKEISIVKKFIFFLYNISVCIKKHENVVNPNSKSHFIKFLRKKFTSKREINPR